MSTIESKYPTSASWLICPRSSYSDLSSRSKQNLATQRKTLEAATEELKKRTEWDIYQSRRTIQEKRKILTYFPDEGPLRRELYAKHLQFFGAGQTYRSRLFRAANRI